MCTDEVIFDAYDTLVNRNNKKLPTSTYVYRFEHVGKLNEQKIKVAPLLQPPLKGRPKYSPKDSATIQRDISERMLFL